MKVEHIGEKRMESAKNSSGVEKGEGKGSYRCCY